MPTESYPRVTDWQNDCRGNGTPSANKFTGKNLYEGQNESIREARFSILKLLQDKEATNMNLSCGDNNYLTIPTKHFDGKFNTLHF